MNGVDYQIEKKRKITGMDYIDCVVDFAEEYNMDVEDLADQLGESIKINIRHEFISRNMVSSDIEGKCEKNRTSLKAFFE